MALVLITHDMGVVAETADRVVVLYAGHEIEMNGTRELFADPHHPYTAALACRFAGAGHGTAPARDPRRRAGTVRPTARLPVCRVAPSSSTSAGRAPPAARARSRSARCLTTPLRARRSAIAASAGAAP